MSLPTTNKPPLLAASRMPLGAGGGFLSAGDVVRVVRSCFQVKFEGDWPPSRIEEDYIARFDRWNWNSDMAYLTDTDGQDRVVFRDEIRKMDPIMNGLEFRKASVQVPQSEQ